MRISNTNKIILLILLTFIVTVAVCISAVPAYAAEGIAVSTADDLKAMENNPSGRYYLTGDIQVPENMTLFTDYNQPFTGTLDGKGHKLKNYKISSGGYTDTGLFKYAKGATFKNFSMTGINVNVTGSGGCIGILTYKGEKCSFSNIKLSGKVTADLSGSDEGFFEIAGICFMGSGGGSISDCQTSVDITAKSGLPQNEIHASGVALYYDSGTIKKCTNSGDITVSGKLGTDYSMNAFGIAGTCKAVTSCKNTGKITVSPYGSFSQGIVSAAGLAGSVYGNVTSCSNTAAVTVKSTVTSTSGVSVAGIVNEAVQISKCKNSGNITVTAKKGFGFAVGGIASVVSKLISQSYNKGAVKVTTSGSRDIVAGGLTGKVTGMKNSYNVGTVSLSGKGYVGGLTGSATPWDEYVTCNYNKATVKALNGAVKGQIAGYYEGSQIVRRRNIFNNYYTGSGKAYGSSPVSWKDWVAKATKVSSITKSKCPKLSSTYWTYSSQYKRLILKNNK